VRGLILGRRAISRAPALSSNTLQCIVGNAVFRLKLLSFNSCNMYIIAVTSFNEWERAMYSASVQLCAMSVCSLEHHEIGHAAYMIMYPVLDLAVVGS
jgi:hypothetical protein